MLADLPKRRLGYHIVIYGGIGILSVKDFLRR